MSPIDLIKLTPLMNITSGDRRIKVGLIDGPVFKGHPDLSAANLVEIGSPSHSSCADNASAACQHGTFVAGMLASKRGASAPGICPACTFLLRPIFLEPRSHMADAPSATPVELAEAILECIDAGAWLINLSVALAQPQSRSETKLEESLDYAMRRGVIVVGAAGNQGAIGSTSITRHPWVIPVVGYDLRGQPLEQSNFGGSIGKCGLGAPGDGVTSLGTGGKGIMSGGTSVAAPFVTGAIALLWSEFPHLPAFRVKLAITSASGQRRGTVVPPLLDAWAAYQALAADCEMKMAI